ncbi:MAG: ABC transporter ATP-binding protein [Maritimibacter sp.]|nr:ABC transporter ATP-binding protein [Maritimibacter sp.]
MAGLTLKNLRKSFGPLDVIKGVSLDIADGEFVVFVGPSGCGKSTILRMISGLDAASGGVIEIDGRDVTQVSPSKRELAMVFQSYALFPHLSVAENIGFGLRLAKRPKAEIAERVRAVARTLQLDELLDRKPRQLSGGQRQRVAIGRSIIRNPKVFLFDEPLSNLDAELRVEMRIEIARLHKEIGATMIYVTHDQVEAMTLADKIVVLRAGRIEQVGAPMDLYRDPDNKFVAGFIGSPRMNFLSGVVDGGAVRVAALGGARVETGVALPGDGQPVIVGLRPQILSLRAAPDSALSVDISEQLGGVSYDYLTTPTGEQIVVEAKADAVAPEGERVEVVFDPAAAMFFDPETEARLR